MIMILLLSSAMAFADGGASVPESVREIDVGPPQVISPEPSSIVSEAQLATSFAPSSEEALRDIPGLIVSRSGGIGQPSFVYIRGADSEGTLVLVDGTPINDPSAPNASFDFSVLSLANIERIEVWKGPQSVLFGSGATGGVINFVTKKGNGPLKAIAGLETGSWNTLRGNIAAQGSSGRYSYSLFAERYQSDGISASDEPPGKRDGASSDTYSTRLGWTPDSTSEVEVIARMEDKKAELGYAPSSAPPYFIEPDPLNYDMKETNSTLTLRGEKRWTSALTSDASLSRSAIERDYSNDPDPVNPQWLRAHYAGENFHLNTTTRWDLKKSLSIAFGASGDLDGSSSQYVTPNSTSLEPNQWLSAEGLMSRLQSDSRYFFLTAGARHDQFSLFGGQNSFELSPGTHLSPTTDLAVRLATAYKIPSFYELYAPIYGNSSLQSEHVSGAEVTLTQFLEARKIKLELTRFRYHYTNLIQFDQLTYDNVGSSDASGIESAGSLKFTYFNLQAGYTYLETRDDSTGQSLLRRPRNSFSARLEVLPTEKMSAILEWVGIDHRPDLDPLTSQSTIDASYQVWNATVIWHPNEQWKIYARADNVLNLKYEEVAGYSTYPLSVYVGGIFTWGMHSAIDNATR